MCAAPQTQPTAQSTSTRIATAIVRHGNAPPSERAAGWIATKADRMPDTSDDVSDELGFDDSDESDDSTSDDSTSDDDGVRT